MPIPDHRITNLQSFQNVTDEPRQIAGLYFYQLLDCLVELGNKVSADLQKKPQLYRDLGATRFNPRKTECAVRYGSNLPLDGSAQ